MKIKHFFRYVGMAMTFITLTSSYLNAGDNDNYTDLVKGNTQFALDIYSKLSNREGNILFSPHSISTVLAMTYAGARNNTAQQMAQVLYFPTNQKNLHGPFGALQRQLQSVEKNDNISLIGANSIWPQKKYPILSEFTNLLKTHYSTSITPVDYIGNLNQARLTINNWVADKTRQKIKNLIRKGRLSQLTRLVLVNAIHFKGDWDRKFDEGITQDMPFFLTPEKSVHVPFMSLEAKYRYYEDDFIQVLEIPYTGKKLNMVILLPKEKDGLTQLQENLTSEKIDQYLMDLFEQKVHIFIPRFKFTSEFDLTQTLIAMGMKDAFNRKKANFQGIDGRKRNLYIGAVVHKAFIEINEKGTEAAAATAVTMRALAAAPQPTPRFQADHPFIFFIKDMDTQILLFLGKVNNPGN